MSAPLANLSPAEQSVSLEELIARSEPRVQRAVLEALAAARAAASLGRVEELVSGGRLEELAALTTLSAQRLMAPIQASYLAAGINAAAAASEALALEQLFDPLNQRAVGALQATQARLVRELSRGQREALLRLLTEGLERGLSTSRTARLVQESIGLTARQVEAVRRYRGLLEAAAEGSREALTRELRDRRFDPTVARAARLQEPLTPAQIELMTTRYRQRLVRFRAQTIAETEALAAIHAADEEAWRQVAETGALGLDEIEGVWTPRQDSNVRRSHSAMRGQARPLGQPFLSGAGNLLRFPGDPSAPASDSIRCRCRVVRRPRRR